MPIVLVVLMGVAAGWMIGLRTIWGKIIFTVGLAVVVLGIAVGIFLVDELRMTL